MSFYPEFNTTSTRFEPFSEDEERFRRLQRPLDNRFRFRNFSPSARKSGEDILRDLKKDLCRGGAGEGVNDMFVNDCFLTPEAMFAKAEDTHDGARGRHQGFRVPGWVTDDHDLNDLAARMSHTPHFATMGRRGGHGAPWRERRNSGGSAMSATSEDDSFDAAATDKSSQCSGGSCEAPTTHEIPIKLEAPPPPSSHSPSHAHAHAHAHAQENAQRNQQCPVRTTSAVDATENSNDHKRSSRCASAPPEMADQQQQQQQQQQQESPQPQRFVSKISITPQSPGASQHTPKASPPVHSPLPAKFNTVPKPFVPQGPHSQDPQQQNYPQQQQNYPQQQQNYPPQQQYSQQQQYPPQQQYSQQPQYPPQQQNQYPSQSQFPQPPLGFFPPQDPQWQFQQFPQQQYQQPQQPQQQPQQESQQQQRAGGQRPSIVRNIPIFVEGSDEPLEQKQARTPPQWTQTRPQPQQPQPPQPQPTPRQQKQNRRQQQHQPTPPPTQPIPHAVPMPMPEPHAAPSPPQQFEEPQTEEPPQPQPQPHPQPQPQQPARDPRMVQIERVRETVAELGDKVAMFSGTKKDREFLYLDEMLTRALLQLDNVDPDGCDEVRQARRAVIKNINAAISNLECRAKDPQTGAEDSTPPQESQDAGSCSDAMTPAPDAAAQPADAVASNDLRKDENMEVDQEQRAGSEKSAEQSAEKKVEQQTTQQTDASTTTTTSS